MELQYWLNGEPIITQGDLEELKYWLNGEPFFYYEDAGVVGPTNMKSYNGLAVASIKSIDGLAIGSIKNWNGMV